jgi:O-antigen/teichoic acid export membrane protein
MNLILFLSILGIGYIYSLWVSIDYNLLFIYSFTIISSIGLSIFENLYILNNDLVRFYKLKLFTTIFHILIILLFGIVWNIYGVMIGFVLSYLLRNLIYFIDMKNIILSSLKNNSSLLHLNIKKYIQFFKHSYLSTTFKSGSQGLDIFILSTAVSSETIALYEAAKKFSQIPGLIFGSIWASKSNIILKLGKEKRYNELYILVKNQYKIFIPLGILSGILFILFGEKLINILYGENYSNIHILSCVFFIAYWFSNLIGGFGRIYFISINKMNQLTYLNSFVFFNILILGFIFARYEPLSMSLLLCISLLINSFYVDYSLRKSHV